ncbi:hypothetical protein N7530_004871 [Penicillium desertorum]|uniref:Uncharacterized protein n=1 Tax=Penicillium desertorum TaxID=1303715 RepID=A0A9X0BR64_9EURO|nr:hypothetical protein N7530_004871 [Penicillium desertorum]
MDDYQRLVLIHFFGPLSNIPRYPVTSSSCTILPRSFFPALLASMSYTAILHTNSIHITHADHRITVQFRSDKQDLSGVPYS